MEWKGMGSNMRWVLVTMLFLLSAVTYLDRINISVATDSLMRDYHLSTLQLGWVMSAFLVGYGLFQVPCGSIADWLGPRRALTCAAIWWAVFTVFSTLVPVQARLALLIFLAIRFSLGAGEAILYPASTLIIATWIPKIERGRANGMIFAGVGVGAGITPPLITYCMLRWGWRSSFWVSAAVGLILGLAWYLIARDAPDSHPYLSSDEARQIREGIGTSADFSAARVSYIASACSRRELMNPNLWAITLAYFSFGYVAWLFFSWFYVYLADARGTNVKERTFYAMFPFLAMIVGSLGGGLLCDWLTKACGIRIGRCLTAAAALALSAVLLVAGSKTPTAGVASVILASGAGALYIAQSSYWVLSADIGRSSPGLVSGVMNMGAQAGGAVTASLTPWIALHFGWDASFATAAAIAIAGASLWLAIRPGNATHLATSQTVRGFISDMPECAVADAVHVADRK